VYVTEAGQQPTQHRIVSVIVAVMSFQLSSLLLIVY